MTYHQGVAFIPIGNPARRRNGTDRIGIPRKSDSEVGTSDKRRNDLVGMNYSLFFVWSKIRATIFVEHPGHILRATPLVSLSASVQRTIGARENVCAMLQLWRHSRTRDR